MHIFLHGPRRIGKSTVIQKTISLLRGETEFTLGGFVTYWGAEDDPHLYIAPADSEKGKNAERLADYIDGRMIRHTEVFDNQGAALLRNTGAARLICMDELGFLEENCVRFQERVYALLDGGVPIIGVLREGDIPWHRKIKEHPLVTLREVTEQNRDELPALLCRMLA